MNRREKSLFIFLGLIILVVFLMTLSSCGPKLYLKKSERALKKAIAKGAVVTHDTLWKTMEVPVPVVETDTLFESLPGDTVTISKDRLTIKYVNLPADSVWIYGECAADTIVKRIPYAVTQNVTVPVKDNKWKWVAIGLGVVLIASIAVRRLV